MRPAASVQCYLCSLSPVSGHAVTLYKSQSLNWNSSPLLLIYSAVTILKSWGPACPSDAPDLQQNVRLMVMPSGLALPLFTAPFSEVTLYKDESVGIADFDLKSLAKWHSHAPWCLGMPEVACCTLRQHEVMRTTKFRSNAEVRGRCVQRVSSKQAVATVVRNSIPGKQMEVKVHTDRRKSYKAGMYATFITVHMSHLFMYQQVHTGWPQSILLFDHLMLECPAKRFY